MNNTSNQQTPTDSQAITDTTTVPSESQYNNNQNQNENFEISNSNLNRTNVNQSTPPTSTGVTTISEEIHPISKIGEALECDAMKRLCESMQSLPLALQQRTVEWTEDFLQLRDKVNRKLMSLQNLQTSTVPPKSAALKFDLRASERVKEVYKKEFDQLSTIALDARNEIGTLFKRLITKVADWETTISKYTPIEEIIKTLLKFSKSLTGSLLITKNQPTETINIINTKSHHVSV